MGATGHMEAGSNRAESEVHQEEKEKVVNERVDFIEEAYKQLLAIDSFLHGYDANEYFLKGNKERDLTAEADLDKKVNENRKLVSETLVNLQASGKTIKDEELAKLLDIPEDQLEDYVKEFDTSAVEFAEDDVSGKIQALEVLSDQLLEKSSTYESEVTSDISRQVKEQLEELKSSKGLLKEIPFFSLDISKLIEANEKASLMGYYDATFLHDIAEEYIDLNPWELTFEEAVNAYNDIEPLIVERFDEHLKNNIYDYTSYIKSNTEMEVSKRVSEHLQRNLRDGGTFKKWIDDIEGILEKTGTSPDGYYLKNVYRTNIQSSYNIAHEQEQKDNKDFFPYLEYIGVDDSRQSDICKTLDGTVRRVTDDFWKTYYPPNHYQCRSGVVSMTKEEFKERHGRVTRINKTITDLDLGDFNSSPNTTNYKSKLKKKEKSWKQEQLSLEESLKGV